MPSYLVALAVGSLFTAAVPISRKLVEMHGGRLWAESTGIAGEGSTFFVELPLEARITETVEKQAK